MQTSTILAQHLSVGDVIVMPNGCTAEVTDARFLPRGWFGVKLIDTAQRAHPFERKYDVSNAETVVVVRPSA